MRQAAAEVAPAVLTAVATTVVSFLPVFALSEAEGRLFGPLAFTKTYALITALGLAMVVLPALCHLILATPVPRLAPASAGAPLLTRLRRTARALTRPAHLRDWLWVALAVVIAWMVPGWLGLALATAVALIGLARLSESVLPPRWRTVPGWLEIAVAAALALYLLSADWRPLGLDRGVGLSLLFTATVIAALLGLFWVFQRYYGVMLRWCLSHRGWFLCLPGAILVFGLTTWLGFSAMFGWLPERVRLSAPAVALAHAVPGFGREFMPRFDEGSYLYMPTTMPHASLGQALEMLQTMDAAIAEIPEVDTVAGKLGRVDSALDPAPISMFETLVSYHPEYRYDADGRPIRQWRDHIRSPQDIWREIVRAAELPGLTSAPTLMPIETRLIMLQSGMRAPLGVAIRGPDLAAIDAAGTAIEAALKEVPAIRAETVFADRVVGKPYLEIEIDREAIGRYGLTINAVQEVIQVALGGQVLTSTIEGRERYPVRVRYLREERDSVEAIGRVLVDTPAGAAVPLSQLTHLRYVRGPQVIKSENTFPTSYVLFDRQPDVAEVDVVEQARAALAARIDSGALSLPTGVSYSFVGSYQNQVRSEQRLQLLVPLALALVMGLLYLQFRRLSTAFIIYSGVAVAVAGGFTMLWLYGQSWFLDVGVAGVEMRELFQVGPVNLSVAVWIGVIALIGIATDDGVVMATYLDQRFRTDRPRTVAEIRAATCEAGLRRVRPCLMTTATTLLALLPVITATGRGADVMRPMALPVVGGMAIELVTLFVVPVLYSLAAELRVRGRTRDA
ncbi:MAG: hypothetical protein Tsb0020_48720 [Haliangiales bacterium]